MHEFDNRESTASCSAGDDRLDSWKEIAAYLGRDTRTAQRWERREGLPVHRHVHDTNATVYAFKSEIDAWRTRLAPERAETATPVTVSSGAVSRVANQRSKLRPAGWVAVLVGSSALILFAFYAASVFSPRRLAALAYDSGSLHGRDAGNRTLWSLVLPKLVACLHGWAGHTVDLDGDGSAEVLMAAWAAPTAAHGNLPSDIRPGARYCLTADGKPHWQFAPQDKLSFGNKQFGPMWAIDHWEVFDRPGRPARIALTAHEWIWWPAMLVVLDDRGQLLGKFVNSGWFLALERIERPSGAVFLAGGISNSHDAGMMAVLDAENVSGRSPEDEGSEFDCANCPSGRPLRYFVFPRSELNLATGSQYNGVMGFNLLEGRVLVYTGEVNDNVAETGYIDAIYEFSSGLELQRASFHDRYWDLHRRLEIAGRITHARAECPDRNGPRMVRAWDPQNGWSVVHPASAYVSELSSLKERRPHSR